MKISELPDGLRQLAELNNPTCDLLEGAFIWASTPQEHEFWSEISRGDFSPYYQMNKLEIKNKIDSVLIDCDGVLTDNKLNIAQDGETLFKSFNSYDIAPIRELIARGIRVIIVTASVNKIVEHFANKVGCELLFVRNKSELDISKYGIFAFVGNDVWDFGLLKKANYRFIPSDSHLIFGMDHVKLQTAGGNGVMVEVFKNLINE